MDRELDLREENNEEGATLVEYALLVALIAVIAIAAIRFLGQSASERFSSIASDIGQS
ncbi:MAG: Flp family type IVb pilin [Bdellovibrionales bacterium]|nr:Flp family type IVb pilin [Bdellovibrionales bacterium]MCB0360379.1 Flp family type IVb pilin [Bdellovibrionales bacterium]